MFQTFTPLFVVSIVQQKEVNIPSASFKSSKNPDSLSDTPSFVRNVMGSSAGAGSGEFHVYRHLRRKEYARQKEIQHQGVKVCISSKYILWINCSFIKLLPIYQERMDDDFQKRIEENREKAESKTAKKRAKRLKKKQRAKVNKPNTANNQANEPNESQSSEDDSDDDKAMETNNGSNDHSNSDKNNSNDESQQT